jgi:hypothetical protein
MRVSVCVASSYVHGNSDCGSSRVISEDDRTISVVGKVESVAEEKRTDKGQVLKVPQRDRSLEQLPLFLQWEELVDELARIGEEIMVVVLVPQAVVFALARLWRLFSVHSVGAALCD